LPKSPLLYSLACGNSINFKYSMIKPIRMDKELLLIKDFLNLINKELLKYKRHDIIVFRMRLFDPDMPKNSTVLNRESFVFHIRTLINKEFALLNINRNAFCSLKIILKKSDRTKGIFYV
jgi:hypothetical protein